MKNRPNQQLSVIQPWVERCVKLSRPVIYQLYTISRGLYYEVYIYGIDVLFPQFDECEKTGTAPLNKRYVNHGQCHLVPAPLCCGPGRAQVQFSTPKSSVDPGPNPGFIRVFHIPQ